MSLLEMLENRKNKPEGGGGGSGSIPPETSDRYEDLKATIHKLLINKLEREGKISSLNDKDLEKEIKEFALDYINTNSPHISQADRSTITGYLLDEVCGYGPITEFLRQT
ncbi:MAG: hypothetical protein PHS13_04730, partial [Firmicutes bacterium]|nr:hypothetical protein [Bacillota bacterium]